MVSAVMFDLGSEQLRRSPVVEVQAVVTVEEALKVQKKDSHG